MLWKLITTWKGLPKRHTNSKQWAASWYAAPVAVIAELKFIRAGIAPPRRSGRRGAMIRPCVIISCEEFYLDSRWLSVCCRPETINFVKNRLNHSAIHSLSVDYIGTSHRQAYTLRLQYTLWKWRGNNLCWGLRLVNLYWSYENK